MLIEFLTSMQTYMALALSASIAAFWTILTKRVDFVNDYFKMVIKKRLAACDSIEMALRPFLVECYESEEGFMVHSAIVFGIENHALYGIGLEKEPKFPEGEKSKLLADAHAEMHYVYRFTKQWVSPELSGALQRLNNYIADHVDKNYEMSDAQKRDSPRDRLARWNKAQAVYPELKRHVEDVHSRLQGEYIRVQDVRGFLKQHRYPRPSAIVWVKSLFEPLGQWLQKPEIAQSRPASLQGTLPSGRPESAQDQGRLPPVE